MPQHRDRRSAGAPQSITDRAETRWHGADLTFFRQGGSGETLDPVFWLCGRHIGAMGSMLGCIDALGGADQAVTAWISPGIPTSAMARLRL